MHKNLDHVVFYAGWLKGLRGEGENHQFYSTI